MSDLAEAYLKLQRGREHLNALNRELSAFLEDGKDPYAIVVEFDPQISKNVARFKVVRPIPQRRWGLILGDAVHNARSALDYIAWRLAGSDPSDVRTFFPLCRWLAKFKSVQWRLERLHPESLALIRAYQPYLAPDPDHSSLWLLEQLDARDKHKLITMTQSLTRLVSFKGRGEVLIPYSAVEQPIEDGTVIAELDEPNVEMELEFATHIVFERDVLTARAGTYDVIRCLNIAFDDAERVIDSFDLIFRGYPHWIAD